MGWANPLWELLYPPACAACSEVLSEASPLCAQCELTLSPLPPGCARCAEPGDFYRGVCHRCMDRPKAFERAHVPFVHEGALARAIHRFKYEDHPELAEPLADLFVQALPPLLSPGGAHFLAIPLHRRRFLQRRYDQAELLGRAVARRLGAAWLPGALVRSRATERQVGLTEHAREQNVEGAFQALHHRVDGRSLMLVDDVLTTGATARAASRALTDAGARSVTLLTLARAFSGM